MVESASCAAAAYVSEEPLRARVVGLLSALEQQVGRLFEVLFQQVGHPLDVNLRQVQLGLDVTFLREFSYSAESAHGVVLALISLQKVQGCVG